MVQDASGRVEEMLRRIQAGKWPDETRPGQDIVFSDVLGRAVRAGDWQQQ
jgi:hypothetical protein